MAHDSHGDHGGHHVFDSKILIRTFVGLLVLTVLTVVTAFGERAGWLPLGPLSVPVALGIAGAKAFLVAAFFMDLWHDRGTNLLVFVGSIVFVVIFIGITWLDFGYRGTFEESVREPLDIIQEQQLEAEAANESVLERFEAIPLVEEADPVLFGTEPAAAPPEAAPVDDAAPADEPAATN
ncbi:MAG: cytochrome C oxidase subunit IV family protein [Bacteroidota bacterium]